MQKTIYNSIVSRGRTMQMKMGLQSLLWLGLFTLPVQAQTFNIVDGSYGKLNLGLTRSSLSIKEVAMLQWLKKN